MRRLTCPPAGRRRRSPGTNPGPRSRLRRAGRLKTTREGGNAPFCVLFFHVKDSSVSGAAHSRTLSLAGVQIESRNGKVEANLAHAEVGRAKGVFALRPSSRQPVASTSRPPPSRCAPVLSCGGFRSALAADNVPRMGYRRASNPWTGLAGSDDGRPSRCPGGRERVTPSDGRVACSRGSGRRTCAPCSVPRAG
jgi:hypothetical protein